MFKKMKKKFNNIGNSFIVVVVSLTCMSILIAAILASMGYFYRSRYVDLENKNNFYYLEKAMEEIYAGVGNDCVQSLMSAYSETVEVMVYYDFTTGKYVTIDEETANHVMKQRFLQNMVESDSYSSQANLYDTLKGYIITEGVELVNPATMAVTEPRLYFEIKTNTDSETGKVTYDKLIIHNITIKRVTSEGYIQSITTDIEITEPEYTVSFSNVNNVTNALYDFSMVADRGIEFNNATPNGNDTITITGNVYAAADYYNKEYNVDSVTKVSSHDNGDYDGKEEKSYYSGIYNDASRVNIIGDRIIVPGTIATMNNAYTSISANVTKVGSSAEIYADNIILASSYTNRYDVLSDKGTLSIMGNMYIADDLEIDSDDATVILDGNYYGYNYSQVEESSIVAPALGEYVTKGHMNSSAIVINGNNANLNFSMVDTLYVAGRAYIETSRVKKVTIADDGKSATITYQPNVLSEEDKKAGLVLQDVYTGESISVKSNQIAYIPLGLMDYTGTEIPEYSGKKIPKFSSVYEGINVSIFSVMRQNGWLEDTPYVEQNVNGTHYYFLNFKSPEAARTFFDWYVNDVPKMAGYAEATDLVDVTEFQGFDVAALNMDGVDVQTNGTYTYMDENDLKISSGNTISAVALNQNSTTYNQNYLEMKYALQLLDANSYIGKDADGNDIDTAVIKNDLAAGSITADSITPINTYIKLSEMKNNLNGEKIGNYYVWISDGDVTVSAPTGTSGKVMGLIIAKGDVTFAGDMERFEGLIITGSKVKVDHKMNFIANAEIVKTILRTADSTSAAANPSDDYSWICKMFRDYSSTSTTTGDGSVAPSSIEIGDVIQYENWKKNVE